MRAIIGALMMAAALAGPVAAEEPRTSDVVPVAALAGQEKAKVAQNFAQPESCETIKQGEKCLYKGGAVEIVFIGGKADWFQIWPEDALYLASSLSQVGLPTDQRPAFANDFVMRWQGLSGLREVELHPGAPGKVMFIYVKALTP